MLVVPTPLDDVMSSTSEMAPKCRSKGVATVAAIFGALPLMFGTGTGSELRHPLGVSIVGGLLVSQVLTLFTTPVIYLAFDRIAARLRGHSPAGLPDAPLAEGPA